MNIQEEIAKTAHELYMKSGCMPGRDLENWVEAERIVKSRLDGGQSRKKHSEPTVEEPVKKAASAPAAAKKTVDTKPMKAPAKRTAKPKKTV
ncbi:MAG: DUF2934 domain-containing protein [Dissulfurispiraceae bacterium]|jgi:hypothetical protein